MGLTVCETKTYLDGEFEAEVFAAKKSWEYKREFLPYKCGNHWHITHKNQEQRIGVGKGHWRCPDCKSISKKSKKKDHTCTPQNT